LPIFEQATVVIVRYIKPYYTKKTP